MSLLKGVAVLVGSWFWVTSFAFAQEDEDLEVEMFFAPAETVTSTVQHAQPLEQSPSAVTVLTREDIQASGARSIPELLRLVPNMDIYMVKPLWYAVGARGVTTIVSDSVLLLVNGRDVTIDFFGSPFSTVQHFSMDDVERVEVIRGPGSALYGANAYSGVINVILPEPEDVRPATVSLRGGEHGFTELSMSAGRHLGSLALAAQAGYEHENLWTAQDQTGRRVLRGRLTGSLRLGDDTRLSLEAAGFRADGLFYTNIGQSNLKNGYYAYGRAIFSHDELELQAIYDQMGVNTDFGLVLEYGGLELARLPELDAVMNKITLRVKHAVNIWHNRATYGAEYIFNSYDDAVLVDGIFREHRAGVYLQDEVDLGGILEADFPIMFTVGMRFDLNSITDWEFSPRASLVGTPFPGHSFRAGYAHAFQKPTFFESSLDIELQAVEPFGFNRLNMKSDLENETIDSVELGYHGIFLEGRLILKADLAYNWYRNLIVFDYTMKDMEYIVIGGAQIPDLSSPGFKFLNEPQGKNGHNLELQAILRPSDRSRLFFQAGYRQVFDNEGRAFRPSEPVWTLGAGADLSTRAGITLSLRAFYTAERQNSFRGPGGALEPNLVADLPDYWLLNARLAWQLSDKPFRLQAGVEGFNLLNVRLSEFGGVVMPNQPDFASERLSRRVIFFLRGDL